MLLENRAGSWHKDEKLDRQVSQNNNKEIRRKLTMWVGNAKANGLPGGRTFTAMIQHQHHVFRVRSY